MEIALRSLVVALKMIKNAPYFSLTSGSHYSSSSPREPSHLCRLLGVNGRERSNSETNRESSKLYLARNFLVVSTQLSFISYVSNRPEKEFIYIANTGESNIRNAKGTENFLDNFKSCFYRRKLSMAI